MGKAGYAEMRLHQALSFSAPLVRLPAAEAVFWPGCALLQLDGGILQKTLAVLRRAEPGMALAAGCCGQPTVYLFPEKADRRKEQLKALLTRRGVRRIYTACPNCTLQLRSLENWEILPVLPLLAEQITASDLAVPRGRYVWHDPCPTRGEPAQQAAARELLRRSGYDFVEPAHTGPATLCCGNYHMMRSTAPEKSAAMRRRRLSELPDDRVILSSCEGCLDAFRSEGRETCHILELLFGESRGRNWGNRLKTTLFQAGRPARQCET